MCLDMSKLLQAILTTHAGVECHGKCVVVCTTQLFLVLPLQIRALFRFDFRLTENVESSVSFNILEINKQGFVTVLNAISRIST